MNRFRALDRRMKAIVGCAIILMACMLLLCVTAFAGVLMGNGDNDDDVQAITASPTVAVATATAAPEPTVTVVADPTATPAVVLAGNPTPTPAQVATATEPAAQPATAIPDPTATTVSEPTATLIPAAPAGEMVVHYLNVGQGDATLIQAPGATILIDAGRFQASDVVPYLRNAGVTGIDLLIGTHAHADHIGQVPQVLDAFPVGEVWMNGEVHSSQTFERAVDAILASDAGYHEPRTGETMRIGEVLIEVLNPPGLSGDHHRSSISVRIVYGSVSFVFTGDAEDATEQYMINSGNELSAHVLQLGHHGSSTSSTRPFLEAVLPEVAIYSAGGNNQFGHPTSEVVDRVNSMGIELYGTDVHGTVRVITDGESYRVETERSGTVTGHQSTGDPAPAAPPDAEPPATAGCVDLNTASLEELQQKSSSGLSTLARTGHNRSSRCGLSQVFMV